MNDVILIDYLYMHSAFIEGTPVRHTYSRNLRKKLAGVAWTVFADGTPHAKAASRRDGVGVLSLYGRIDRGKGFYTLYI